jgi:hypothetical protein
MKKHFQLLAISVAVLIQPLLTVHAEVVRNPVDVTPTALKNSGADYGANVVTASSSKTVSPSERLITDPITDNDDVTHLNMTRSSALVEESDHASETTVMQNRLAEQQQQIGAVHSRETIAFTIAFALLIAVGVIFGLRKRDSYLRTGV